MNKKSWIDEDLPIEYETVCDGKVDLSYNHAVSVTNPWKNFSGSLTVNPNSFNVIYLDHNFDPNTQGILYIFTNDELREKGIYILDQILEYNGEKKIKVNLFSYDKKSITIQEHDSICSIILNEIKDGDSDE